MSKIVEVFGANKKDVFELPFEMAIYVPSTQDVDKVISVDEMNQRVDEVRKFLAKTFGGYTSNDVLGGFIDSKKELVNEDVVKVTAFSTKEDFEKSKAKLLTKIGKWGAKWGQEAIGLEYEGNLFYVPQNYTPSSSTKLKKKEGGYVDNEKEPRRKIELTWIAGEHPKETHVVPEYFINDVKTYYRHIIEVKDLGETTEELDSSTVRAFNNRIKTKHDELELKFSHNKVHVPKWFQEKAKKEAMPAQKFAKHVLANEAKYDADTKLISTMMVKLKELKGADVESKSLGGVISVVAAAYIGYKIGRSRPQKKGFSTEAKVLGKAAKGIGKGAAKAKEARAKRKAKKATKKSEGGSVKYKKVRTLKDIQNDPRVRDVHKDTSTGEIVWWMYLKDGLVSHWDGAGTITTEDTMSYLKETLNTEGVVITEEEYKKEEYSKGGVITEYDDLPTKVQDAMNKGYDEDEDPYKAAEKMRSRLQKVGWDMDYDLSGAPTEFWKVEKKAKGGKMFTPEGREILYKDENVALQHNKVSDHYSLIDPETGRFMAEGGAVEGKYFEGELSFLNW